MENNSFKPRYSFELLIIIALCSVVIVEEKVGKAYLSYLISLIALVLSIQSHITLIKTKRGSTEKLEKTIDQTIIVSTCAIACVGGFVLFNSNIKDIVIAIGAYNLYNFLTVIYISYLGFSLIQAER